MGTGIKSLGEALATLATEKEIITRNFRVELRNSDDNLRDLANCIAAFYRNDNNERITPLDTITRERILQIAKWLIDKTEQKWAILMQGGVGNGKTTLVRAIDRALFWLYDSGFMAHYSHKFAKAVDIAEWSVERVDHYEGCKKTQFLTIDDLGQEDAQTNQYGNIKKPLADVLTARYEQGLVTIITTNLDADDLLIQYGDRVCDRLREMATVIPFDNESYRGK